MLPQCSLNYVKALGSERVEFGRWSLRRRTGPKPIPNEAGNHRSVAINAFHRENPVPRPDQGQAKLTVTEQSAVIGPVV